MRKTLTITLTAALLLACGCTSTIEEGDLGIFPFLEVDRAEISAGDAPGTFAIGVYSNRDISVSNGNSLWMKASLNSTHDSVIVEIEQNTEFEDRSAEVIISISDGHIAETVTVTQFSSGMPSISLPSVLSYSDVSMDLTAEITNPGSSSVIGAGFILSTLNGSETEYPAAISGNYLSATATGLSSSTQYYIRAYAENASGRYLSGSIAYYTAGAPVMDSTVINVDTYTNSITITATMSYPGSSTTTYGLLLGREPELTEENAEYKTVHNDVSSSTEPITWTDTFYDLRQGTGYYFRTYAVNEYGTSYGNEEHTYTTGTPDLPRYNITADISIRPYENQPEDLNLSLGRAFQLAYFRDDIRGSGDWAWNYTNILDTDTTITFETYEGKQKLVYLNINPGSINEGCDTKNDNELVRFEHKEWYVLENLLYAVNDVEILSDMTIAPEIKYLTSYIDLEMTYTDANGNQVSDLSTLLMPDATVEIDGLSRECAILEDGSSLYEGEFSGYSISSYDENQDSVRSLGSSAVLPSSGRPLTFSVTLNFTDGSSRTLDCGYGAIKPGRYYRIRLNLLEVSYENGTGFELEVIEDIDEDIEIEF
ncbi:MAG TPA: BACON domain-containing protein [Candidatus Coprenecus avistercoris]|uniref:BACON domain-containing protein n=1 Tax=Candidatus Coprenecus avistercoris TaxID=2840730 RepID=A0A9D1E056_9BACT|nr:BACON domain-containing protein [Candidatus Coprenecus avistercoris]